MKKAFTYFAISLAAAPFLIAQPALGQPDPNNGDNGAKRVLVECDTNGNHCQIVRRLRSPAACQNSRVNATLHHRASTFLCVGEEAGDRRTGEQRLQ